MKTLFKSTILGLALLTTSVYAGDKTLAPVEEATNILPIYVGLGIVAAQFSGCENNCDYEDRTYGTLLKVGYDFNQYIGIEARGIRTFLDKGPFGGAPLQHLGLFAKPQYPVSQNFNIYGLWGYGYTENLGNGGRLNYFDNADGFSAGLGVEYNFTDEWGLFLDYQRLLIESDIPDMDVVSFGVRYDF